MTPLRRWRPSAHGWLVLAAILAGLGWSMVLVLPHLRGEASLLDRIEAPLTDLRFLVAGPRMAPEDVVIVAIDDETVRAAGSYPLPRIYLARLLRRLGEARPKTVAVDVLLLDPDDTADAELADALKSLPAVVATAAVFTRRGAEAVAAFGPFTDLPVAERILQPTERLRGAAGVGLVNAAKDHGGTPRHIPMFVVAEGALHPALALRAAARAEGRSPELSRDHIRVGARPAPLDLGANLALRFYGPQGSLRTVSARSVLDGEAAPEALAGKTLVIGATALGSGDTLSTPFDPVLPGVELLATGISHLLHGDALIRTTTIRRIDAGLALALPVLVLLTLAARRTAVGLGLAALAVALFVVLAFAAFGWDVWLSLSLPLASVAVPVAFYLGARLWLDRRQERRLEAARDSLLRFHPPALAARLESEPDYLEKPVAQDAAVLFVDLSGFTGLSERLGPARTRALLKEMHDLVEDAATPRGGSVTAFMGDGAMVLFGLPDAHADDADRAVAAALALARSLPAWIEQRIVAAGEGRIGVRIGVHAGPVVVSRLGGTRNQQITATGDTVNVASRLLEIAKAEGALVVLTTPLLTAMRDAPGLSGSSNRKTVSVRGRVEPLEILAFREPPADVRLHRPAASGA